MGALLWGSPWPSVLASAIQAEVKSFRAGAPNYSESAARPSSRTDGVHVVAGRRAARRYLSPLSSCLVALSGKGRKAAPHHTWQLWTCKLYYRLPIAGLNEQHPSWKVGEQASYALHKPATALSSTTFPPPEGCTHRNIGFVTRGPAPKPIFSRHVEANVVFPARDEAGALLKLTAHSSWPGPISTVDSAGSVGSGLVGGAEAEGTGTLPPISSAVSGGSVGGGLDGGVGAEGTTLALLCRSSPRRST